MAIVGTAVIGDVTVIGRVPVRPTAEGVRTGPAPGLVRRAAAASGVLLASAAAVVGLGVLADVAVAVHAPAGPPVAGAPR